MPPRSRTQSSPGTRGRIRDVDDVVLLGRGRTTGDGPRCAGEGRRRRRQHPTDRTTTMTPPTRAAPSLGIWRGGYSWGRGWDDYVPACGAGLSTLGFRLFSVEEERRRICWRDTSSVWLGVLTVVRWSPKHPLRFSYVPTIVIFSVNPNATTTMTQKPTTPQDFLCSSIACTPN